MKQIPVHPVAALWPVRPDDVEALSADFSVVGQREPIVLLVDDDGKKWVIDGRTRLEACKRAGIEPRFREVTLADIAGDVAGYVLSANALRRDLIPAQRAIAIALASADKSLSARQLAERVTGTNREYVRKAVTIVAYDRDLALQVLHLEAPIERAYRLAAGDSATQSSDESFSSPSPTAQETTAEQLPARPQPKTPRDRSGTAPAERAQPPERELTDEHKRIARETRESMQRASADVSASSTCATCGKRVVG